MPRSVALSSPIGLSLTLALALSGALSCGTAPDAESTDGMDPGADGTEGVSSGAAHPGITATNAFYYYEDVDAAWRFYSDVLAFETVSDFGFAKIMRVAPSSYLTLVDEERGMHSADEPKSVTLAVVTEEVEAWYAYLTEAGVPMRAELNAGPDRPHDGFVAIDPEGYLLEFERFNPHDENVALMPVLNDVTPLFPGAGATSARPADLGVQATVLWLYYDDIPGAQAFYETALGLDMIVDQGWAKVYPASGTGFLGLVDGSRGLHQATSEKGVTVSFFVDDVEPWFARMQGIEDFRFRTEEIGDESGRVRTFVGYDVEGYFLEWDTFLDVEGNEALVALLRR
jgi:predicted enzyme related to lactoylglutathione lyase